MSGRPVSHSLLTGFLLFCRLVFNWSGQTTVSSVPQFEDGGNDPCPCSTDRLSDSVIPLKPPTVQLRQSYWPGPYRASEAFWLTGESLTDNFFLWGLASGHLRGWRRIIRRRLDSWPPWPNSFHWSLSLSSRKQGSQKIWAQSLSSNVDSLWPAKKAQTLTELFRQGILWCMIETLMNIRKQQNKCI